MNKTEVTGVLSHEVAHIANGDMVTMTLVQGVVNAFVMFLARILAFAIAQSMRGDRDRGSSMSGFAYHGIVFVLEMVFMIFGSMVVAWFSRQREFRADAGGANLGGREKMVAGLESLRRSFNIVDPNEPATFQTMKISGHPKGIFRFFATHPPLEERIARLQSGY
jgi:heat shock protein HtpX